MCRMVMLWGGVMLLQMQPLTALNNGLGLKPGLGWNSDYCTNCAHLLGLELTGFQNGKVPFSGGRDLYKSSSVSSSCGGHRGIGMSEVYIKHIADTVHDMPQAGAAGGKTFQELGYHYINMDASWNTPQRQPNGDLTPDPKLWPYGIDNTIEYVHSRDLGFGLYGDRGTKDCAGKPGALGHETQDAEFFARHKVDWYKEDSCSAPGSSNEAIAEYGAMRDALNKTGRPIWFALCGWHTFYASDPNGGNKLGNSARIGPDTGSGWSAVMTNIESGLSVARFAGPGYWNDGSLMLTPGMGHGTDTMSENRHRSQFSAWAIMAMNILMVGNLSSLDPYVLETWSNPEVLSVNQDDGCLPAVDLRLHAVVASSYTRITAEECGGEPTQQNWTLGSPDIGYFFNGASKMCLNVAGCNTEVILDGCVTGPVPTCDSKNGSHPNEAWVVDTASNTIKSQLPGQPCLTLNKDHTISVLPCVAGAQSQKFTYEQGKILTSDGLCVTSGRSGGGGGGGDGNLSSVAIGRPLIGGDAAVLLLNNLNTTRNMSCNASCVAAAGLKVQAGQKVTVRDLWLHKTVAVFDAGEGFNVTVEGAGASRMFRLSASLKE